VGSERSALARAAAMMPRLRDQIDSREVEWGGTLEASVALSYPGEVDAWLGESEDPRSVPEQRRLHFRAEDLQKRLVYADWCEEAGLMPRAELIRQQIDGKLDAIIVRRHEILGYPADVVFHCGETSGLDGEDFWPGAALDAARAVVRLPGFDYAEVAGGFVESVRFTSHRAAVSYAPFLAATLPVCSIHFPGPRPVEADGMWWWGQNASWKGSLAGYVLRLDGRSGVIPWQVKRQTMTFCDLHNEHTGDGFSTHERAMYALFAAYARWGALTAFVNNLFPSDRRGRDVWRRHASRPVDWGA
jgi:uncharacterized protein (TIGR02996 family)